MNQQVIPGFDLVFFLRKNFTMFFTVLGMSFAFGQYDETEFIQYTVKDGLSDNNINCITQDNRGFVWIGTEFGLNRFDGNQFEKYYQGTPAGFLTSSYINKFSRLAENRFAIITKNGLQVVN